MISIYTLNDWSANNQTKEMKVFYFIKAKILYRNEKEGFKWQLFPLMGELINSKILNLYHELNIWVKITHKKDPSEENL